MKASKLDQNPFRYGADFCASDLVGRQDEIVHLERTIRDGARMFLAGPLGFGKTSILRATQQNMDREGAIVLYVNADTTPDIGDLTAEIAADAEAYGLKMRQPAPIDSSAGKYVQIARLASELNVLDKAAEAQSKGRKVALIIDEFSSLMARSGVMAEAQLRSDVQMHQNLAYIFSGSNVQFMLDMTGKYGRPFYHGGDTLFLRSVLEVEFATWIHRKFRDSGYDVDSDEPIQRILSQAEGVPLNVQMLAHHCWEELRIQSQPKLTTKLVGAAFARMIQSLDSSFRQAWNRLTPLQQKTLIAVLRADGQRLKPIEIARSISSPASSARSALQAIYRRLILWNDSSLSEWRVRAMDPFFACWIKTLVSTNKENIGSTFGSWP